MRWECFVDVAMGGTRVETKREGGIALRMGANEVCRMDKVLDWHGFAKPVDARVFPLAHLPSATPPFAPSQRRVRGQVQQEAARPCAEDGEP